MVLTRDVRYLFTFMLRKNEDNNQASYCMQ